MDQKLINQLIEWHNSNEHFKIIDTIESIPTNAMDYTLKNLLARAYNNESKYDKALEVLLPLNDEGENDTLWNFRVGYAYYYKDEPQNALPYFQKSALLGDDLAKSLEQSCLREIAQANNNQQTQIKSTMTLNAIAWSFSSKTYADKNEFNQEVIDYQTRIFNSSERWKPEEIVFDFPELEIQYMAWITAPSDLLPNETLIDDDATTFEDYPDEDEHQVEIVARLKADNGKHFTALEFLLKAHNQQANKELGDHVFFEGTDENPNIIDNMPICYIACGS